MKRALTSSEKILMGLCGGLLVFVGLFFSIRDQRARRTAAAEKIADLEPKLMAVEAAAADAPFWETRQAWLETVMPAVKNPGQAHSKFLEDLEESARSRGLYFGLPVLLKPEPGKHAQDFSVTVQIAGPDNAVFRWLAELQSPEKLRVIKYLLLVPQPPVSPPRMGATVTIAQLFKP